MPSLTDSAFALWLWPLNSIRLAQDFMETAQAAQRVIATRMPMISTAIQNPLAADRVELSRMVTEKVSAFGVSNRSIGAAGKVVERASTANARALGKMAGGTWLWPMDWIQLAEANMAAAAALATLPAAALAPLHKGVTANDKRLRRN